MKTERIVIEIMSAEVRRYVSFQDIYGRTYETPVWHIRAYREGSENAEWFDWATDQDVRPGMVVRATPTWEGLYCTRITRGRIIAERE